MLSGKGIDEIGFRLGHAEAEFSVFDDDEGVALMYGLVFLETDFLYESLNPCVYGSYVLLYLGIVRIDDPSWLVFLGAEFRKCRHEVGVAGIDCVVH